MIVHDTVAINDARLRLGAVFGCAFGEAEPVSGGRNNRLYRLVAANGLAVLVKRYVRDDRRRLEREFGAMRFLRARVGALVPAAILSNPDFDYAVYSFETGATRTARDLTLAEVEAMARCAAELHTVAPHTPGCPKFPPAVSAAFSIAEAFTLIEYRLTRFEASARASSDADVRAFAARVPARLLIGELVSRAVKVLPPGAHEGALPTEERRLSNADFAPHNILVRPNGSVCSVDWEYAGWDDPARLVAGFLAHVHSLGLPTEHATRFQQLYAELRGLPEAEVARMAALRLFVEVEWATNHLEGMTEERLRRYLHARPDADPHAYFAEQIADCERRLARVQGLLG